MCPLEFRRADSDRLHGSNVEGESHGFAHIADSYGGILAVTVLLDKQCDGGQKLQWVKSFLRSDRR